MAVKMHKDDFQADAAEVSERFKAFLDYAYQGNQSALAAKLGISQPAISRVASGEQLPSGKLLLALSKHTDLNLVWLFTGQGPMLLTGKSPPATVGRIVVPVADQPLPGPPEQHAELLTGERIAGSSFSLSPTRYWLRIRDGDLITRDDAQKVKAGDLVLLETDRRLFPAPELIFEELWVVRLTVKGQSQYRLAEVSHAGGNRLEADTFDLDQPGSDLEQLIVLRPLPGGKYDGYTQYYERSAPKGGGRKKAKRRRVDPNFLPRFPHAVEPEDLIARKVVILRR